MRHLNPRTRSRASLVTTAFSCVLALLAACGGDGYSASDAEEETETETESSTGKVEPPSILCDPLATECDDGSSCLPTGKGFDCQPYSVSSAGAIGDACGAPSECRPGLYCQMGSVVSGCSSLGCCASWCDLDRADPCLGIESCQPWFSGEIPDGGEHIGICGISP